MHLRGFLFLLPVTLALSYTKAYIISYSDPLVMNVADIRNNFMEVGKDQKVKNGNTNPVYAIPPAPVLAPLSSPELLVGLVEENIQSTFNDKTQKSIINIENADEQDKEEIVTFVRKFGFVKPSKVISFLSGMPLPLSLITSIPSYIATIFPKPKYYVPVIVDVKK